MTRTDRPRHARSASHIVLHRDGTVTLWDCHTSAWMRGVPGEHSHVWATLDATDRARVARHIAAHA